MEPTSKFNEGRPSARANAQSTKPRRLPIRAGIALTLLAALPIFAFHITGIRLDTQGLRLDWAATAGKSYAVETSASVDGPWNLVHQLVADGVALTWSDPAPTTNQAIRLYRIHESDPTHSSGSLALSLQLADVVPIRLGELFASHLDTCASAIYLASNLRGGVLTTNGTLTQSGVQWSYATTPADALAIRFATGTNLSYRTRQLIGDFSGNASTFINNGHAFEFQALQPGVQDLWITSHRPAGNCNITPAGTVAGTFVTSNITFTIDVQATGPYCFETDSSGYSLLQDYRTTGTVVAPGFRLAVDHRRRYEAVGSGPGDATSEQVWMAHQLVLGADTYVWADVKRQKSFRNGKASQWQPPGYWSATGQILKNGVPVAAYSFLPAGPPSDIYIRFLLQVGIETVELESWAAY